tara:strand:- start:1100 stop:1219 length:120 start_codon:yes stop_codon:yes gene_type:complete
MYSFITRPSENSIDEKERKIANNLRLYLKQIIINRIKGI